MSRIYLIFVLLGVAALPLLAQTSPLTVDAARSSADDAVQLLVRLHEEIADQYFHSADWPKAVATLDQVITLEPTGIDAYASAAWLLWSSGKDDLAMDYYQRMIAANPTDPEGYFVVGSMFFSRRRYAEALPWLEKAIALGLHPPKSHLYGHALVYLGRTADALAFWQKQLADNPTDEVARREIPKLTPPAPLPATAPPPAPAAPVQPR